MKAFWKNQQAVSKTPIVTVVLIEAGHIQQLYRMWTEMTAAGQSFTGWLCVWAALILWCNFYRICCPKEGWAFGATAFGVFMVTLVWLSILWFRYIVRV